MWFESVTKEEFREKTKLTHNEHHNRIKELENFVNTGLAIARVCVAKDECSNMYELYRSLLRSARIARDLPVRVVKSKNEIYLVRTDLE